MPTQYETTFYQVILDFNPPTPGGSHKDLYSPFLFNSTTGAWATSIPALYRYSYYEPANKIPYFGGVRYIGSGTAPTKADLSTYTIDTALGSNIFIECFTDASADSLVFLWYKNSSVIAEYFAPISAGGSGYTWKSHINIAVDNTVIGATYHCVVQNIGGTVTSGNCAITVGIPPIITTDLPSTVSGNEGTNKTFTVNISGTSHLPLTYTWNLSWPTYGASWSLIPGETTNSYTRNLLYSDHQKAVQCIITNSYGYAVTVWSEMLVTPIAATPPSIVTQPLSISSITAGDSATFTVVAGGSAPLAYQWYSMPGPVLEPSFTSNSFTLTNVPVTMNGIGYYCVVTNGAGTITSDTATLGVSPLPAPTVSTNPGNQNIATGATATFNAIFNGTGLTYQWYGKGPTDANDTAVPGATSTTLNVTSVTVGITGYKYRCMATNVTGSVLTLYGTLTVDGVNPKTLTGIGWDYSTFTLNQYPDCVQLRVSAIYSDATTSDITNSVIGYDLSNTGVASCYTGAQGLILATAPGTATITAHYGGFTATTTITVTSYTLTSIDIGPLNDTLPFFGSTLSYFCQGHWSGGFRTLSDITRTTQWLSSNTEVATIAVTGVAYSIGNGLTTITATAGPVLLTPIVATTYLAVGTGVIPAITAYRPSVNTGVAFPGAIDTTSSTVDSSTWTSKFTSGTVQTATFSSFGTGTYSGILHVNITGTTETVGNIDDTEFASSHLSVQYNYNGGGLITLLSSIGGNADPVGDNTVVLSSVDLSTLVVTVEYAGARTAGTVQTRGVAAVDITLYDIVFIT